MLRSSMFASATNSRLTETNDTFYPAQDPRVVSVDSENGQGIPAPLAKRMVSGSVLDRFCAPGLGSSSPNCQAPLSRSSFACSPVPPRRKLRRWC
jgi:hypothetical protein